MTAKRRNRTGRCSVCVHVERTRIELLLVDGVSQHALGRKYDLSHDAISRHWRNHVSPEKRAALALGPVSKAALAARLSEESESVLDHHRSTRAGLLGLYDAAVTAGDRTGGALLAGRLTEVNNAIGKLTGQLLSSPLIQNTVIHNTLQTSPEYQRLVIGLLELARAHPAVRPDLMALLKRLDSEPARPATPASTAQLPAIEHEGSPK